MKYEYFDKSLQYQHCQQSSKFEVLLQIYFFIFIWMSTRVRVHSTCSYQCLSTANGQADLLELFNILATLYVVDQPVSAENTHHRGQCHCMADLLFDWFGFNQTSEADAKSTEAKHVNPKNKQEVSHPVILPLKLVLSDLLVDISSIGRPVRQPRCVPRKSP